MDDQTVLDCVEEIESNIFELQEKIDSIIETLKAIKRAIREK